jgi:predicted nucleotidyltransferase component of viral defense system
MIGFGELRRFATRWHVDVTDVERAHATNWLLKRIFDDVTLARVLVLRGASALRYAYCADYPILEPPEFLVTQNLAVPDLLSDVLRATADRDGVKFLIASRNRGVARVDYVGALGRRSAAQPRIMLNLTVGQTRLPPTRAPLIHPFSDACVVTVSAIALEEWIGDQLALLTNPRARDVYDLWFALTHAREKIDPESARQIARHKLAKLFDETTRARLERVWDGALRGVRDHPPFAQVESDLRAQFLDF